MQICYANKKKKIGVRAGTEEKMESIVYIVKRIDGDYAWLENTEHPEREPVFIARALLPDTVFEGAKLLFENFEYTQI
jgi:hypothetical protein